MNIAYGDPGCPHPEHNYQKYITMTFKQDDELLQKAIVDGKNLAKNVNPYDPGSTIRNPEKIERRCICGVLAELAVKELLKQHISNHNIDAKVFQSITTTNGSDAGDQIDIPIEVHGVQKNIEVRSSFPYSPLNTVITRLFDIIGWYKSEHKSMEHKKDYYLRVLYNFREEDTIHVNSL